ncbi:LruC domain-containing protein [Shewanella submarina]|uniref:LruC domain-containing protein n=1 Tax=Shewanella submarina TaxID=2016376 RepID=A0ABV7GDQ6_9GAMM|nr:LruC domain-containing protein [Shewanella submarina]MCL1037454.1 LruC domain-containing protein [Shewanella submarina]
MSKLTLPALVMAVWSVHANATPFDTCPSKAYLFQSAPVKVYGVNLVTGATTLLEDDTGTTANVNGVGFNFTDRYIYGYDTTNKKIVRMGKNFQVSDVNTSDLPTDHTFFVGDVYDHTYYLYRANKGLFKIDLSPLDSDANAVLPVVKISSRAAVSLTDMAFHPGNGKLYGIDNNSGFLYEFDPTSGQETYIADTGQKGTFGAGYFDVNGYYYVSRNNDVSSGGVVIREGGKIYRVNMSLDESGDFVESDFTAVEFADGPMSNQNDGARCANAPVIDEDSNIDFGDAPDSYKTTLASNGPRHQLDELTWLGLNGVDGDADGAVSPDSDDTTGIDDEDGIGFVTAVEPGLDTLVTAYASTSGYLSGWIDWDGDGEFDEPGDKVFEDQLLQAGQNVLFFEADLNAVAGDTWSRFRFSQQTGLDADGGSTSGEVEDHGLTITAANTRQEHFPSSTGFVTLAYEDNYPYTADYDMNDVVMFLRVTETLKDDVVAKIKVTGQLAALGASYHNGFAIRLPNVARTDVNTQLTYLKVNGQLQSDSGMETDMQEASFVISNDLNEAADFSCQYFRTLENCREDISYEFELTISFNPDADVSGLPDMPYDPFIFATPDKYHGEGMPEHPGRSWEVHLADQAPTEKFDKVNIMGLGVDDSNDATGKYFKTSNNLPWALMLPEPWEWPKERVDLLKAYPDFEGYATEGDGTNALWYKSDNAVSAQTY